MDTRNLDKKKWYAFVELNGLFFFHEAQDESHATMIARVVQQHDVVESAGSLHYNGMEWLVE